MMWDDCGMARTEASLKTGAGEDPRAARASSGTTSACPAATRTLNQALEQAGRVADFLEFAELLCHDALDRNESCGGHFREEYQTAEGEAKRDDENYSLRRRLGVARRRRRAGTAQGAADVRGRPSVGDGVTSNAECQSV